MIGRFLNLEHRKERRESTERELVAGGFVPRRIPGIKLNSPKGIGCALAHVAALADGIACEEEFFCIFEDDFRWLRLDLLAGVLDFFRKEKAVDGLLLTGWHVRLHPDSDERNGTARVLGARATAAYVVRRAAAYAMLEACSISLARAFRGLPYEEYAIDVLWSVPMHRGHWRICQPRIAGLRESHSDVEGRTTNFTWIS